MPHDHIGYMRIDLLCHLFQPVNISYHHGSRILLAEVSVFPFLRHRPAMTQMVLSRDCKALFRKEPCKFFIPLRILGHAMHNLQHTADLSGFLRTVPDRMNPAFPVPGIIEKFFFSHAYTPMRSRARSFYTQDCRQNTFVYFSAGIPAGYLQRTSRLPRTAAEIQQISAPAGMFFSGVISARAPSASSAHSSIPSESTPASFAGFKFTSTMTFFPTISSGE